MPSIMLPCHKHDSTTQISFVICVILMGTIFPGFNLKPDGCNLVAKIFECKPS